MDAADSRWLDYWSMQPYTKSNPDYSCDYRFGTDTEPASSIWCASLLDGVRDLLIDNFGLLDWGCGDGRCFSFLSSRFRNFTYFGVEPYNDNGLFCRLKTKRLFGADRRFRFGYVGDEICLAGLAATKIAVMGSVATHMSLQQFGLLLQRFKGFFAGGGVLTASFLFGKSTVFNRGAYDNFDCWDLAVYDRIQLSGLLNSFGLRFTTTDVFYAQTIYEHNILRIEL